LAPRGAGPTVVKLLTIRVSLADNGLGGSVRTADCARSVHSGLPEFPERGRDEIALLGRAFNRMRRSLQKAMQMIES